MTIKSQWRVNLNTRLKCSTHRSPRFPTQNAPKPQPAVPYRPGPRRGTCRRWRRRSRGWCCWRTAPRPCRWTSPRRPSWPTAGCTRWPASLSSLPSAAPQSHLWDTTQLGSALLPARRESASRHRLTKLAAGAHRQIDPQGLNCLGRTVAMCSNPLIKMWCKGACSSCWLSER